MVGWKNLMEYSHCQGRGWVMAWFWFIYYAPLTLSPLNFFCCCCFDSSSVSISVDWLVGSSSSGRCDMVEVESSIVLRNYYYFIFNRESWERSNFIVNPPITKRHLICTAAEDSTFHDFHHLHLPRIPLLPLINITFCPFTNISWNELLMKNWNTLLLGFFHFLPLLAVNGL